MINKPFKMPADPKTAERIERKTRIENRIKTPKASPNNKDVMDMLADLYAEIRDVKQ